MQTPKKDIYVLSGCKSEYKLYKGTLVSHFGVSVLTELFQNVAHSIMGHKNPIRASDLAIYFIMGQLGPIMQHLSLQTSFKLMHVA